MPKRTPWIEYDWPPEPGRGPRRPRVEVLPPEPEPVRVRLTITPQRPAPPPWLPIAICLIGALVLLVRFKLVAFLLFAWMLSGTTAGAVAMLLGILALAAYRSRRQGRPF